MRSIGQEFSEKRFRMRHTEPLATELGERVMTAFAIQILPKPILSLSSKFDIAVEQKLHPADSEDPSWPHNKFDALSKDDALDD